MSWDLYVNGGSTVILGGGAPYSLTGICLANGCYTLQMQDSFGDGWNGNDFSVFDIKEGVWIVNLSLSTGSSGSGEFCIGD